MTIGDKIKELRKSKGLTQEELADKCGLSKNGLWNYENNKRKPNTEILDKIAAALGVSSIELMIPSRNLTSLLFIFTAVNDNKDNICKLANIDIGFFKDYVDTGKELPEDTLINLIDLIFQDDEIDFLRFYQDNYDLLREHGKLLKFCRLKKKKVENVIYKDFNKSVENEKAGVYSKLSKSHIDIIDYKQILCEYINFNYQSNFENINEEYKLTEDELNSLYEKSVEYISLLTDRIKNKKMITKLDNSANKKEVE